MLEGSFVESKIQVSQLTEAGKEADGLLFGESFIKDLGRYVGAFTAPDKAQSSMLNKFHGQVSTMTAGLGAASPSSHIEAPLTHPLLFKVQGMSWLYAPAGVCPGGSNSLEEVSKDPKALG